MTRTIDHGAKGNATSDVPENVSRGTVKRSGGTRAARARGATRYQDENHGLRRRYTASTPTPPLHGLSSPRTRRSAHTVAATTRAKAGHRINWAWLAAAPSPSARSVRSRRNWTVPVSELFARVVAAPNSARNVRQPAQYGAKATTARAAAGPPWRTAAAPPPPQAPNPQSRKHAK